MSRLVNESNINSNTNINYRNKNAYATRVQARGAKMLMKTDFAKGIETLNVERVDAALRLGYRPTAKTASRAYYDIRKHQKNTPYRSRLTKKVGEMYSVLIKYKLEPDESSWTSFVESYVTGSLDDDHDYLELPTPVIRKMLTKWRVFIRCDDRFISDMVYKTIGRRGSTFRPNHIQVVKMLFEMCKKHRKTLIRTGTKMSSAKPKLTQLLLTNLPRNVLQEDVDFRYTLSALGSRKQARIEHIQTLRSKGIDLRQVIIETRYPDELKIILDRVGNEYVQSGELYYNVGYHPKMTKFLLQRGMDPNSSRRDLDRILNPLSGRSSSPARSPLRVAIEQDRVKDIRLFKKKGITVTPEMLQFIETYYRPDSPIYKLLIPSVRQRKVSIVNAFNTVDPVALTPVPLNKAMIYPSNTSKVYHVFHPNTVSRLHNTGARHPMTQRPVDHSKARKLMPLLRKADHKRYHDTYARDVAANANQ